LFCAYRIFTVLRDSFLEVRSLFFFTAYAATFFTTCATTRVTELAGIVCVALVELQD
jgi:hypothetical protein